MVAPATELLSVPVTYPDKLTPCEKETEGINNNKINVFSILSIYSRFFDPSG
jgi:hypothetical protein